MGSGKLGCLPHWGVCVCGEGVGGWGGVTCRTNAGHPERQELSELKSARLGYLLSAQAKLMPFLFLIHTPSRLRWSY